MDEILESSNESIENPSVAADFLNIANPSPTAEGTTMKETRLKVKNTITDSTVLPTLKMVHASCQTTATTFGPLTDAKYLLGEVRPWGKISESLYKNKPGQYRPTDHPGNDSYTHTSTYELKAKLNA